MKLNNLTSTRKMTTYSISLDEVDLALLPLRTHKYNDFLKREHFQFELMIKEPAEESAPTVVYTCHICAVEVPAAFAREHAASVKHRASARIASVAAQRMRRLVAALPPPVAEKPPGRFCANCSAIVGKNHDKTKEHRVAAMHDKLLMELMNAYVGEKQDDVNSDEASDVSDDATRDNKQVNDIALGNAKFNRTDVDVKREERIGLNNLKTADVKTIEKPDDKSKTNAKPNKDKLETENVKVETKNEANTKTEVKVDHVEFVTKNKELVKVSIDQYHSFVRRDDKTECIVCRTTFNSEDANSHMFSVKHLNLMPSTMVDENCIRKINDVYSHCLLCNQMVKNANVTKHQLTSFHRDRKKQAVTGYTKKTFSLPALTPEDTDASTFFWDPINENMEEQMAVNSYYNTCELNGQTKYNPEEKVHSVKKIPNNTADKVPNITENAKVNDGKTIKANTDDNVKPVAGNSGVKMTDTNTKADKNNTSETEMKTNVDWPVIYPYEVIDQESSVRCVICDCKVPNTPGNRKTHLKGSNHFKNVKSRKLNPFEAIERSPWCVRCVICDRIVLKAQDHKEQHLTKDYHILNAMLLEQGESLSKSTIEIVKNDV